MKELEFIRNILIEEIKSERSNFRELRSDEQLRYTECVDMSYGRMCGLEYALRRVEEVIALGVPNNG